MADLIRDLNTEYLSTRSLKPYPNNARTHSKKQIDEVVRSIRSFGWTNPILVDGEGSVIAGHCRLEAAKQLGLETVPVIRIEDMTPAQKRAYIIADNRLAEKAGWDDGLLATEFQSLIEIDPDFDITLTGFELPEIDILIDGIESGSSAANAIPDIIDDRPAVSALGDLWHLGPHRLICGDAQDQELVDRVTGRARVDLVFTDPPYNVPIAGNVSGLGRVTHREFVQASGEMNSEEYLWFLLSTLNPAKQVCLDGSILYVCMDWRHIKDLLDAGVYMGLELINLCVWNKSNGGMGSLYRSKHELVAVFKNGTAPHINNVELGKHGRNRTNVWDYPGISSFGKDRDEQLAMHPTVKPVEMVEDAIRDCSNRGGLVLDPFCGSGTTIIAAERSGRRCAAIELDPLYVDVTLRRYRDLTGVDPVHAASGLPFSILE